MGSPKRSCLQSREAFGVRGIPALSGPAHRVLTKRGNAAHSKRVIRARAPESLNPEASAELASRLIQGAEYRPAHRAAARPAALEAAA